MAISSIPRAISAAAVQAAAEAAITAKLAAIQATIVNDATPFSGVDMARLDVAVSSVGGDPSLAIVDIWSVPAEIALTSGAGDKTLPDVVIPDLGTYTIVKAYAMYSWVSFNNLDAVLTLNVSTYIQVDKAAAGYINAISTPINMLTFSAAIKQTVGQQIIGSIDISSRVANNATSNFKWANVSVSADSLIIGGFRTGIRLIVRS